MNNNRIIQTCLFSLTFALYAIYLCPGNFTGDSPLLAASAFAMGPAHPPGYPLYVQLGKAATFLPLANVAYKLNLFSALAGALAALLVYRCVKLFTEDDIPAIFSALLAAFTSLAWAESTKAEVYTLNSALIMLVVYLGLRHAREGGRDDRLLMLAAFVLGIGMGNHHTIGLMAVPLGITIVATRKWRVVVYCAMFFFLGLSIYAFSFARSLDYVSNKGLFAYSDSSTLKKLYMNLVRAPYGSTFGAVLAPFAHPGRLITGLKNTLVFLISGRLGVLGLFTVLSAIYLWKKSRFALMFFVLTFAAYAAGLASMIYAFRDPSDKLMFLADPYMLPVVYIAAAAAGWGIWLAVESVSRWLPALKRPLALGVVLLPFVFVLPGTLKGEDISGYYIADDFADNLMLSLSPSSVYVSSSDPSYFPLGYKSYVEKKREDVLLTHGTKNGIITQSSPRWRTDTLFENLPAKGPFSIVPVEYLATRPAYAYDAAKLPEEVTSSFDAVPHVHTYRLIADGSGTGPEEARSHFLRNEQSIVYERANYTGAADRYTTEYRMWMFTTASHLAYLMKQRGSDDIAFKYYEDSIALITIDGLVHYLNYLDTTENPDEIEALLDAFEPYAQKYPEVELLRKEIKARYL